MSTEQSKETDGTTPEEGPEQISSSSSITPPPEEQYAVRGWRLGLVFFCIFFGIFFGTLDSSIVATVLVTISKDFNDFGTANWVVLAYLLTYMGFAMIVARLSDIFGRKWMLMWSNFMFGVFSLACGFSQSMIQLVVFRAFQGIGAAGLLALGFASLPDLIPVSKIAQMTGFVGVATAAAAVIGPLVGGAIGSNTTWRWVFWLNAPGNAAIVTMLFFLWPKHVGPKNIKVWKSLKSIDFPGAVLLLAGSILLVFALQEGARFAHPWNSATIIVCFVISALCLIGFVAWELMLGSSDRFGIYPMLPTKLVGKRSFGMTVLLTSFVGFAYFVAIIDLPERVQIVNGKTAILSGVYLLPLLASTTISSTFVGVMNSKKNRVSQFLIACACTQTLGMGLLSTLPNSAKVPAKLFGFEVILGLGIGGNFSASAILAAIEGDQRDRGIAQGMIMQARFIGGSIGLAIATIVLNYKLKNSLTGVIPDSTLSLLYAAPTTLHTFTPELQTVVRGIYSTGFNDAMRVTTYISIVAIVLSLATWSKNPTPIQIKRDEKDDQPLAQNESIEKATV